jgi:threonine dehydrogenase-like Zn-dependent dehydrogenase
MAVLHSYERAADLFAEGVLRPDVLISHRLPLEDYPKALDQFANGIGRKIQVIPT